MIYVRKNIIHKIWFSKISFCIYKAYRPFLKCSIDYKILSKILLLRHGRIPPHNIIKPFTKLRHLVDNFPFIFFLLNKIPIPKYSLRLKSLANFLTSHLSQNFFLQSNVFLQSLIRFFHTQNLIFQLLSLCFQNKTN